MTLAAGGDSRPVEGLTDTMLPSRTATSPTNARRDPSQGTTVPPRTSTSTGWPSLMAELAAERPP